MHDDDYPPPPPPPDRVPLWLDYNGLVRREIWPFTREAFTRIRRKHPGKLRQVKLGNTVGFDGYEVGDFVRWLGEQDAWEAGAPERKRAADELEAFIRHQHDIATKVVQWCEKWPDVLQRLSQVNFPFMAVGDEVFLVDFQPYSGAGYRIVDPEKVTADLPICRPPVTLSPVRVVESYDHWRIRASDRSIHVFFYCDTLGNEFHRIDD
jgi:hypothetical protein